MPTDWEIPCVRMSENGKFDMEGFNSSLISYLVTPKAKQNRKGYRSSRRFNLET